MDDRASSTVYHPSSIIHRLSSTVMLNRNRQRMVRYAAIAAVTLATGLIISFRADGTWWLLLLAGLAWLQVLLLRREIVTSGLPLRLFNTVSWALLGFAAVSLLPDTTHLIGDIVILLLALASFFVGPRLRRAR